MKMEVESIILSKKRNIVSITHLNVSIRFVFNILNVVLVEIFITLLILGNIKTVRIRYRKSKKKRNFWKS